MDYTIKQLIQWDPDEIIEEEIGKKLKELGNSIDIFIEECLGTFSDIELFKLLDAIIGTDLNISTQWFQKLVFRLQQSKNRSISYKVQNIVEYYKDLIYKGDNKSE